MMKRILFLALALVALTASAQTTRSNGLGLNGTMLFHNENDVFSVGVGADYNWFFGEHVMLSAGGGVLYNMMLDENEVIDSQSNVNYKSEKGTLHLTGALGITLSQRVWRSNGVYVRGDFVFDLLPFESIGYKKRDFNGNGEETNPSKLVFTGFSPGVFGEAGVYHDFKKCRMFVGFGYGAYDLFHSYRHHSVHDLPMSYFAPDGDRYYRLTLRLAGL
ncbi:MAG: outer membrane beta-barrel protein [Prevotella sp.]|nr:outer membrane beta-barrel protein [Prevotella sp.]